MRSPTWTHVAAPPTDGRLKACAVSCSQLMPYPAKTKTRGRCISYPTQRLTHQVEDARWIGKLKHIFPSVSRVHLVPVVWSREVVWLGIHLDDLQHWYCAHKRP